MTFKKYQTTNNASCLLEASIATTGDTLIIESAKAELFPTHNGTTDKDYLITLEHFVDNQVTKREIVLVTKRVGNVLTVTKGAGYCAASRDATTQTNTKFGFNAGDVCELRVVAENNKDIQDEMDRKLSIAEYQSGTYVYGASSTGNDDYSITLPVGPSAYTIGQNFRFMADTTNVGSATLNVNGLGAKVLNKQHDRVLEGGDIEAGQIVTVAYDGTHFQMDSQVATIPQIDINGQLETEFATGEDEVIVYNYAVGGNRKSKIKNLPVSALTNSDYLCGEAMAKGDSMFVEVPETFANATNVQNIGDVSGNTRAYIYEVSSGTFGTTFNAGLGKFTSPSVNLNCKLQSWNGSAWTDVHANAVSTIAPASLDNIGVVNDGTGLGTGTYISSPNSVVTVATFVPTKNINNIVLSFGTYSGDGLGPCRVYGSGVDFSGNAGGASSYVMTVPSGYIFISGQTYTVTVGPSAGSWTAGRNNATSGGTNLTTAVNHTLTGITSKKLISEKTMTWNGTFTAPVKGTPIRYAFYAGNRGSETVNATNYYGIAYSTKDTTVRQSSLWDGTIEGAKRTGFNIYLSSVLNETNLLSKTDADFTYKLPDIPRLATQAYSIGELVKYDELGTTKAVTGTKGDDAYISNTPGQLSSTAGTNSRKIGKFTADNQLYINPVTL